MKSLKRSSSMTDVKKKGPERRLSKRLSKRLSSKLLGREQLGPVQLADPSKLLILCEREECGVGGMRTSCPPVLYYRKGACVMRGFGGFPVEAGCCVLDRAGC